MKWSDLKLKLLKSQASLHYLIDRIYNSTSPHRDFLLEDLFHLKNQLRRMSDTITTEMIYTSPWPAFKFEAYKMEIQKEFEKAISKMSKGSGAEEELSAMWFQYQIYFGSYTHNMMKFAFPSLKSKKMKALAEAEGDTPKKEEMGCKEELSVNPEI